MQVRPGLSGARAFPFQERYLFGIFKNYRNVLWYFCLELSRCILLIFFSLPLSIPFLPSQSKVNFEFARIYFDGEEILEYFLRIFSITFLLSRYLWKDQNGEGNKESFIPQAKPFICFLYSDTRHTRCTSFPLAAISSETSFV